ncbi:hypothetical protein P4O66_011092 [Electrophorus voltai]|uniref:Uncharacterized protein n=1 Tax=Electrophorus voltai TaxID=2609070 RepID=A0AAD9DWI6_9TELE|nr:hypothetical protein P4O66_011092 [Electrophorus voltai]
MPGNGTVSELPSVYGIPVCGQYRHSSELSGVGVWSFDVGRNSASFLRLLPVPALHWRAVAGLVVAIPVLQVAGTVPGPAAVVGAGLRTGCREAIRGSPQEREHAIFRTGAQTTGSSPPGSLGDMGRTGPGVRDGGKRSQWLAAVRPRCTLTINATKPDIGRLSQLELQHLMLCFSESPNDIRGGFSVSSSS